MDAATSCSKFYPAVPESITVNYNWSCRPKDKKNAWKKPYLSQPFTFKTVMACLARGPFVSMSAVGPACYSGKPNRFTKQIPGHKNVSVFGWKSGATRVSTTAIPIIVCGTQQRKGKEFIYFVLAQKAESSGKNGAIGTIIPLETDRNVYVSSMNTFARHESDTFPPISEEETQEYRTQEVVPTVFAGNSNLYKLAQQGKVTIQVIQPPK